MSVRYTWRGEQVTRQLTERGMRGLITGAEHILSKTIDDTPKKDGTLRRSGTVSIRQLPNPTQTYNHAQSGQVVPNNDNIAPNDREVFISFNTPYAIRQHEDLNLRHTDGKAKYLEDNYNAEISQVEDLVAAEMGLFLRRGR